MRKSRVVLMLAAAAAVMSLASPARANHYCALERVSHTVNTICNGYHDPKGLISYIACIARGQCPIS